jgi:hypothetical protein
MGRMGREMENMRRGRPKGNLRWAEEDLGEGKENGEDHAMVRKMADVIMILGDRVTVNKARLPLVPNNKDNG